MHVMAGYVNCLWPRSRSGELVCCRSLAKLTNNPLLVVVLVTAAAALELWAIMDLAAFRMTLLVLRSSISTYRCATVAAALRSLLIDDELLVLVNHRPSSLSLKPDDRRRRRRRLNVFKADQAKECDSVGPEFCHRELRVLLFLLLRSTVAPSRFENLKLLPRIVGCVCGRQRILTRFNNKFRYIVR